MVRSESKRSPKGVERYLFHVSKGNIKKELFKVSTFETFSDFYPNVQY